MPRTLAPAEFGKIRAWDARYPAIATLARQQVAAFRVPRTLAPTADGHVGPLAVTHRASLAIAFRTALVLAAESGAANLSAFLPGPCEAALAVALATGMRITIPMVLMATDDFGNWTQYLPRNPGFM
jgi:hypothetical protein